MPITPASLAKKHRLWWISARGSGLALVCLMALHPLRALARPANPPADVDAMLRQARNEIREFEEAGGKKDDPRHPVQKWAVALWAIHDKSPQAPDSATAAGEAIHLLIHADRFQEARDRADSLPPTDAAWGPLPGILFEAATMQKDFTWFFQKLEAVAAGATDAKTRASVQVSLGRGWRAQKDDEKAKAAFRKAIESARDSAPGRQALAELYEVLHLGPGQPAPLFSAAAIGGSKVGLADYRGKPVALVFWATH